MCKNVTIETSISIQQKEYMFMVAYFSQMKKITDGLSMASCPVFNKDFVL